jgi:hypothetical protein
MSSVSFTESAVHRTRAFVTILFATLLACNLNAANTPKPIGLLIYKNYGFDPNSNANITEITAFESFPTISRALTVKGAKLEVEKGRTPVFIPYPSYGGYQPEQALSLIAKAKKLFPQHVRKLGEAESKWTEIKKTQTNNPPLHTTSTEKTDTITFTATDGTKYTNVSVVGNSGDGLSLMSDSGVIRIPFTSLPPEIRKKYEPLAKKVDSTPTPQPAQSSTTPDTPDTSEWTERSISENDLETAIQELKAIDSSENSTGQLRFKQFSLNLSPNQLHANILRLFGSSCRALERSKITTDQSNQNVQATDIEFRSSNNKLICHARFHLRNGSEEMQQIFIYPPFLTDLFKATGTSIDTFAQQFINNYNVESLEKKILTNKWGPSDTVFSYTSKDGWKLILTDDPQLGVEVRGIAIAIHRQVAVRNMEFGD